MLRRLHSATNLLVQDVNFIPGINIILGKTSSSKAAVGTNGIGKSSIIRLVDYCLLSDRAEKTFQNRRYDFLRDANHSICLDFEILGKSYCIQRFFKDENKVYFGTSLENLHSYTKTEIKLLLQDRFFPIENERIYLEGNKYRALMNFFIKDDLEHQERIEPLNFLYRSANSADIALYNFYLLGLPTMNLTELNKLNSHRKNIGKAVKGLTQRLEKDTGRSLEEFKTEKVQIEAKIQQFEESLQQYEFIDGYKDVEIEALALTSSINEKLLRYRELSRKLRKINESFERSPSFDSQKVGQIYNEVLENFGEYVKRSIDEVQQFKQQLLENRKKYLVKSRTTLQSAVDGVLGEISQLEKQRKRLYKFLDEKGALDSIKNTYEQLIATKAGLESNSSSFNQINKLKNEIAELSIQSSTLKKSILDDLANYEEVLNSHRLLFNEILRTAIFLGEDVSEAYFDVSSEPETSKKDIPVSTKVSVPKADALGQSRLKIVAYDLMVFLGAMMRGRSLPNFLVHDGVFHSISMKTKVNTLNYIFKTFLAYPHFQYIVTFNDDEFFVPEDKIELYGEYIFDVREAVIIELQDEADKVLFKRIFE